MSTVKFVAISDTHCRHRSIQLPPGDVLLHAGDISNRGKKDEIIDFIQWFSDQPHPVKIFIAGNHDFYFQDHTEQEIKSLLPSNIVYLNDSGCSVNGIRIWGSPVTPWFYNWAFNRKRGVEISAHWKKVPDDTDVLLVHGPPFGILDQVINEKHVGCRDLRMRVDSIQPRVVVFGHVHESFGKMKKGSTTFVNACLLNECYELVNRPVVFDL